MSYRQNTKTLVYIFSLVVTGLWSEVYSTNAQVNVTQFHNHDSRDGLYVDSAFTPGAAANLARDLNFDGTISGLVYAQPLYIDNGPGGRPTIIAVTESNNVYALDAVDGSVMWQRNVGDPVLQDDLTCRGAIDQYGITGTPIVDLASRALFFNAMITPDGGITKKHLVFSLNIDTGDINPGWPVDVGEVAIFNGVTFTPSQQAQRPALGIVDNILYVPYGGLLDCRPYHGWLVGVPINNPADAMAWATSAIGGSVWGVGGVASDGTNPFITTGNTFNTGGNWMGGEAVIRFQPGPIFTGSPDDYWAPLNWLTLDDNDEDFGSCGPLLVDVPGATPSSLVVASGKDGNAYLLDRSHLGGINQPVASSHFSNANIKGAAATYRTNQGTYVAVRAVTNMLLAFRITATNPPAIVSGWSVSRNGRGSPFVTSTDGTTNTIVWVVGTQGDQRLHGYDGDTGAVIYGGGGANELMAGTHSWSTTGIAARGHIYVGTDNKVYAFVVPGGTPTPTSSPTATATATATATHTPTPTPRPSVTPAPTPTAARTPAPTPTPTATATPTPTAGSFAAVILATEPANLKGYWKCDETSGTTLADSSGNSKNLTITGAINANYWLGEAGEQGRCFRTDGVAGYASRNDAVIPSLDNTNFTLFALFKGGTDFGSAAALAISNSLTDNDRAHIGELSTTSQASARARGHSSVMAGDFSGGTAFDGSWHSVAFRRNGTAFNLFVDGTRVASTAATLATGSTCNRTTLMHILRSGTTAYAKGSIQHAAIWNRALSDSEITAIQAARSINPTPTPTPTPGSFAAVILATEPANLKGYWKCDETSGTTLADSSGNSKNLTITGAINANYWLGEAGEQGRCFRTDGVAGYASRNDAVIPSLDNTNFTLFALFKGGTDFGSVAALAISNSLTDNDRAQIGEFSTTSQAIALARGHSAVMASGFSGGTAFDGSWHSVAFRRNGTAFNLFVDGTRVASTTATLATGSTCNRTTLMHILRSGTSAYAKGRIQHAAIWNRALSDSEITAIQAARSINPTPTPTPGSFAAVILATEPANLKGYWKCDETSGTSLADSSGNSKNLTITGAINTNYWLGETGEQGRCFRTDGVAGYASRNDAVIPSLDNTNFTLFALFKGGTDFGSAAALAISNSLTDNDRAHIGELSTTSQASARARGHSSVMAGDFSGGTAFDGSWHSVAFRRNGTAFNLFVDGTRVASTAATLATGSTCNRTTLMHILRSGTTAYAKGSIQHAAIWNTALSDSEIMAIQTARTGGGGRTYSTNFPLTENPISEGGNWVAGQSAGNNLWGDIQTNGTIAFGVSEPTQYGDPTAILTGPWGPNQTAQAVVKLNQVPTGRCCTEAEVRLRTTINPVDHTITGYEIFCSVIPNIGACNIVTWGGPNGSFRSIARYDSYLHEGDVLKAVVTGTNPATITAYINDVEVMSAQDSGQAGWGPWTTGSPGIGFYNTKSQTNWSDFGFSSFSAHD